jgi:hypothetical protein
MNPDGLTALRVFFCFSKGNHNDCTSTLRWQSDGTVPGQSSSDKLGFYGKTAITLRSLPASIGASATSLVLKTALNQVRNLLKNLGLGRLMAKIHWTSAPNVSEDERQANAKVIEALGLPKHRGAGRLAIVGGGPSIRDHMPKNCAPGTVAIWAVNGTIKWCAENGVDAFFYTADASPLHKWSYDLSGAKKAVLAPDVSPDLVAYLQGIGATVTLTGPIQSGPTSANASDYLSIECGYTSVTYFGCEGSFAYDDTHAFNSVSIPDWMTVEVGGEHYRTKAEYVSQSIMLANVIKEFPAIYSEKSGGLLRAMIEHGPDYDVYMVSDTLFAKLTDRVAA